MWSGFSFHYDNVDYDERWQRFRSYHWVFQEKGSGICLKLYT